MGYNETNAPMASAPFVYNDDRTVAWDRMWDSFCTLASNGGPPHRASMLKPQRDANQSDPQYRAVVAEIARGVNLVSGLNAQALEAGWVAIACYSAEQAKWLADQIVQEGVSAWSDGAVLRVPAGADFTVEGEIKNVITAVAKTTHYWREHMMTENNIKLNDVDLRECLAAERRVREAHNQAQLAEDAYNMLMTQIRALYRVPPGWNVHDWMAGFAPLQESDQ